MSNPRIKVRLHPDGIWLRRDDGLVGSLEWSAPPEGVDLLPWYRLRSEEATALLNDVLEAPPVTNE